MKISLLLRLPCANPVIRTPKFTLRVFFVVACAVTAVTFSTVATFTANTAQASVPELVFTKSLNFTNICYAQHLLSVARVHTKTAYGNRPQSGGLCAQAVREDINIAQIAQGVFGDAIDYAERPFNIEGALIDMGFENLMDSYPTPEGAPAGSVLVFAGPHTDDYLRTGTYPGPSQRHGEGAGDWVGHITIRGDAANGDDWYYTDGRTEAPAVPNRTLVGVFMLFACKNCPQTLKAQCMDQGT